MSRDVDLLLAYADPPGGVSAHVQDARCCSSTPVPDGSTVPGQFRVLARLARVDLGQAPIGRLWRSLVRSSEPAGVRQRDVPFMGQQPVAGAQGALAGGNVRILGAGFASGVRETAAGGRTG